MVNPLIFIGIALIYALLKVFLEKRWAGLDYAGEEGDLSNLAFACGCSVYDLFKAAGSTWNIASTKIDEDFRQYLKQGRVPAYVRDGIRRNLDAGTSTYSQLIFSGGRPPYL